MFSEKDLKQLVEQVLVEMANKGENKVDGIKSVVDTVSSQISDEMLPDLLEIDLKKQLLVDNAEDKDGYLKVKEYTPARLGVGRAGARYKTETMIRFRADHAAAQDAVFSDVPEELIKEMGFFSVQTMCRDKDEYLTRPDLGRKLGAEAEKTVRENCKKNPTVQIYVSDGLSSTAIGANIKDVLPALMQGLQAHGIDAGTPFFVRLGRVAVMDQITEITGAEVTCVLIGERPGLVTAESMSAYITYKGTVGMPESRRTVLSNIHSGGTPAVEAGAHIADIIKKMLEEKASGVDLKL